MRICDNLKHLVHVCIWSSLKPRKIQDEMLSFTTPEAPQTFLQEIISVCPSSAFANPVLSGNGHSRLQPAADPLLVGSSLWPHSGRPPGLHLWVQLCYWATNQRKPGCDPWFLGEMQRDRVKCGLLGVVVEGRWMAEPRSFGSEQRLSEGGGHTLGYEAAVFWVFVKQGHEANCFVFTKQWHRPFRSPHQCEHTQYARELTWNL